MSLSLHLLPYNHKKKDCDELNLCRKVESPHKAPMNRKADVK